MIGTTAALVMGGLGAANLVGAHKQASAAKDASQQQIEAANRAMAMQTPLYNQALQIAQQQAQQGRADLMPYAQQGGQGLTALTALLGLPGMPAAPPMPDRASAAAPPAGFAAPPAAMPGARALPPGAPTMGTAVPRGTAPQMVLLRAPNGQTQSVPAEQAEFFVARGAQRV